MRPKIVFFVFILLSFQLCGQGLDANNGYKEYKLGKSITEYPNATIGNFSCRPFYPDFYSSFYNNLSYANGFEYNKMIKDYVFKPNNTIFGFKVHEIVLSTYSGKIVRIIVRVNDNNNVLFKARSEFGNESSSNFQKADNSQTYNWHENNVEMTIMHFPTPINFITEDCKMNYYDIHFFSKSMINFLELEVKKIKSSNKGDY